MSAYIILLKDKTFSIQKNPVESTVKSSIEKDSIRLYKVAHPSVMAMIKHIQDCMKTIKQYGGTNSDAIKKGFKQKFYKSIRALHTKRDLLIDNQAAIDRIYKKMKKLFLILFIPLNLVLAEIYPPKVQVLEISPKVRSTISKVITDWAHDEMLATMKELDDRPDMMFLKSMALYRFTASDSDFADKFLIMSDKGSIAKTHVTLKSALVELNKLKESKDIDKRRLAWYYFDYLSSRYPNEVDYQEATGKLPKGNWLTLVPGYSYRFNGIDDVARSETKPIKDKIEVPEIYQYKARAMVRNKATVNGLVVITLRNGRKKRDGC